MALAYWLLFAHLAGIAARRRQLAAALTHDFPNLAARCKPHLLPLPRALSLLLPHVGLSDSRRRLVSLSPTRAELNAV
jgi:hypothetical protein